MKTNDSKNQASTPQTKLINYRTYNLNRFKVIPIDRRSIFGNPFKIDKYNTREDVISAYEEWFYERITHSAKFQDEVDKLKGKILGCWCAPLLCHGDVIIEYLENLNQGDSKCSNCP